MNVPKQPQVCSLLGFFVEQQQHLRATQQEMELQQTISGVRPVNFHSPNFHSAETIQGATAV